MYGYEEQEPLPESLLERMRMLEGIMTAAATGGGQDNARYHQLRLEFISNDEVKNLIPSFIRTYRSLDAFWPFIQSQSPKWAGRRQFISESFTPVMDYLEGTHRKPGDKIVSDTLESFDAEGVHLIWEKALARRTTDPEGAITTARTLLETVCKRILDEKGVRYTDKEDLPKLYSMVAKELNLAPDQHTEEPIKAILGGAMNMVNGIGTLRNRFSDAHGRGGKVPVRPSPRHAQLAVNTAGSVATFLVETYLEKIK